MFDIAIAMFQDRRINAARECERREQAKYAISKILRSDTDLGACKRRPPRVFFFFVRSLETVDLYTKDTESSFSLSRAEIHRRALYISNYTINACRFDFIFLWQEREAGCSASCESWPFQHLRVDASPQSPSTLSLSLSSILVARFWTAASAYLREDSP